jgi:outer membrane protein TolC
MRSFSWWVSLAVCSVALAAAGTAAADEPRALGHDETLRLAAERNAGLLVASLERVRSSAAAEQARRPYLPEVAVQTAVRDTLVDAYSLPGAAPTAVGTVDQRGVEAAATLTYGSPYGQKVNVSAGVLAPLGGGALAGRAVTIELSQALLRGGPYGGAADLRQADLDVKIAREQYRARLNELLQRADRAYWDLAFAREDVEIKRRSRDRARAQFEETRENIRRGLLAPGEIYVVEENVVNFDDLLSRAEENLAVAASALRRILNLPPAAALTASTTIDVSAVPGAPEAQSQDVAAAGNPSVLAARLAADRASVGIGADARAALPQLDVFGRFGAATGSSTDFGPSTSGYRAVLGGLRVSLPLFWGPDAARVQRARTELLQRRADLRDAESAAATAVHDAAVRIRAREQRLDLASRLVQLGQKKLDVERDKYRSGLSTLADVVRFQRDLDAALSNAIRARVDVLEARTELLAARGDLHDAVQVAVK